MAATMWMAHGAAIHTIATGGIGGVHRGESGDESADLVALARWPVAVVCSGVKAVLDLPRTRERLETLGVPVLGLMTPDLPAFYRRSSGLPVDHEFATVDEVARAIDVHWRLGGAGVVVAHPVPAEDEMPRDLYESAITRAVEEAAARRLAGRGVTPFLLERMRELTGGKSLVVNRALLRANAAAAARLAASLAPRTDAFLRVDDKCRHSSADCPRSSASPCRPLPTPATLRTDSWLGPWRAATPATCPGHGS